MLEDLWPWMHLGSRFLFALVFLVLGLSHLTRLNAMAGYTGSMGIPAPRLARLVTGLMQIVGGLTILLGLHRYIGAGLLFLLLVPTAFLMHAFWKQTDPTARQHEMIQFLKDLALAGGALFIATQAGTWWPLSFGH